MLDTEATTPVAVGFPVALRPLLALVIVLAIGHMVLRTRVRKATKRPRRTAQRRGQAAPMKESLPIDPADALAALRRRADEGAARS
jgi:hypothetical protein